MPAASSHSGASQPPSARPSPRPTASSRFEDNSTAGNAAITANGAGSVDFSGTTGPNSDNKVSAGSIAGSTTFFLGGNQLTVGNNNLSTNVSGTIEDGGSFGGTGASLVKTGTGTLDAHAASIPTSGGTTVTGGLINFAAGNNLGSRRRSR